LRSSRCLAPMILFMRVSASRHAAECQRSTMPGLLQFFTLPLNRAIRQRARSRQPARIVEPGKHPPHRRQLLWYGLAPCQRAQRPDHRQRGQQQHPRHMDRHGQRRDHSTQTEQHGIAAGHRPVLSTAAVRARRRVGGLAPYHLHINASFPEHRDSENVVPTGEDIFEANIADQSVQAIVLPFYSPIVRGSGYANCGSAFEIRCRPLSAGATRAIGSWSAMGSTFMGRVIQVGRNLGRSDFHAKMVIFPSLGFTELFLL